MNLSLGGPTPNQAEGREIRKLVDDYGMLIIAAAGNSGNSDGNPVMYPASFGEVLSVGALKNPNEIAGFSSHNLEVDIVAPGQNIESIQTGGGLVTKSGTCCRSFASQCSSRRRVFSLADLLHSFANNHTPCVSMNPGTSMACPHVVGCAALLMSQFPDEPAERIREALEESAVDLGACGYDSLYGHGRVDVMRAAKWLEGDPTESTRRDLALSQSCVEIVVRVTTDDEGEETKWIIYEKKDNGGTGRIVFRGGPYANDVAMTRIIPFSLPENKQYEFVVFDDYSNGHGEYKLFVGDEEMPLDSSSNVEISNDPKQRWSYDFDTM